MPSDPREELRASRAKLHARLARHGRRIGRVEVSWSVADGDPRMTVTLKDRAGQQVDQWEGRMILGETGDPSVVIIDNIIKTALGAGAINNCAVGDNHRYYTIG